jgi:hypothetical protein
LLLCVEGLEIGKMFVIRLMLCLRYSTSRVCVAHRTHEVISLVLHAVMTVITRNTIGLAGRPRCQGAVSIRGIGPGSTCKAVCMKRTGSVRGLFQQGPQNQVHPVPVGMTSTGCKKTLCWGVERDEALHRSREAASQVGTKMSPGPKKTTRDRHSIVATFRVLTLHADQQFQHDGSRRVPRSVRCRARGTVAAG